MSRRSGSLRPLALHAVPESLIRDDGSPRFGAYDGIPDEIDLGELDHPYSRNRLVSFLRHKRWNYFFAATDALVITGAIVDAGPTGTCFIMVTDRSTGEVLADASRPGGTRPLVAINTRPQQGHRARYDMPGTHIRIAADDREMRVEATLHRIPFIPFVSDPWVELDLRMDLTGRTGISAVTEVCEGSPAVTTTFKNAGLPVRGQLTVRDSTDTAVHTLTDGLGGFDYTSGFLPRATSWRWAFATGSTGDGTAVDINLVSDFSGIGDNSYENMAWVDGEPHRLPSSVRVEYDSEEPLNPWSIRSEDGDINLTFQPLAVHRESLNLGVFRSRFIQPAGHMSGRIRAAGRSLVIDGLPGVVEDQDVLW